MLSDQVIVHRVSIKRVASAFFAAIFSTFQNAGTRVGHDHVAFKEVVALYEGGFCYDVELTEGPDANSCYAVALRQYQIKYGLPDEAAVANHKARFADPYVAAMLAVAKSDVADRIGVCTVCRAEPDVVRAFLATCPPL